MEEKTVNSNSSVKVTLRGKASGKILYWVGKIAGSILAPNFHRMDGLKKAIEKNRKQGTAKPSGRLLKQIKFEETEFDGFKVFEVERKNGCKTDLNIIYLHGGAMVIDLQGIQWALVEGLLSRIDAKISIPIYPLAPEYTYEKSLPWISAFYDKNAAIYGSKNIVVAGDSAGGLFSLLLAQSLRDQQKELPAALVLYSPVIDIAAEGKDQPYLETRDPSVTISLIRNAATLWAPNIDHHDPKVCPLYADQTDLPPTLIFTGDREVLESDALRLKERNPQIDHRSYAEMSHVFPIGGTKEGAHAFNESAKFIAKHTNVEISIWLN